MKYLDDEAPPPKGRESPTCFDFFLPPKSSSYEKKYDLNTPNETRVDGGMYWFVPCSVFARTALLIMAMGTVAGLSVLAIVYISSVVEGGIINYLNEQTRNANQALNNQLGVS